MNMLRRMKGLFRESVISCIQQFLGSLLPRLHIPQQSLFNGLGTDPFGTIRSTHSHGDWHCFPLWSVLEGYHDAGNLATIVIMTSLAFMDQIGPSLHHHLGEGTEEMGARTMGIQYLGQDEFFWSLQMVIRVRVFLDSNPAISVDIKYGDSRMEAPHGNVTKAIVCEIHPCNLALAIEDLRECLQLVEGGIQMIEGLAGEEGLGKGLKFVVCEIESLQTFMSRIHASRMASSFAMLELNQVLHLCDLVGEFLEMVVG